MKSNSLVLDLFIPDEDKAMTLFKSIWWGNGVYCPDCKSFEIYNLGVQGKSHCYSCKKCGLNFSDLIGTFFANNKLPKG